jgi:Ni,Fe-hydrogenase III small subunit
MTRRVDDIIHTAGDPVIAIRVSATAITGKIISRVWACVDAQIPVMIKRERE